MSQINPVLNVICVICVLNRNPLPVTFLMCANNRACVANALFYAMISVGDYTLPLDHSVLIRSDICQLGCHRDMWVYVPTVDTTCLGRALWFASGEWRGWDGMISLGASRLSGSCEIGFDARSTMCLLMCLRLWM